MKKELTVRLPHPEATLAWGRLLAAKLRPPLMVALTGNLGAGKTSLAQGLARGLGVAEEEPVVSPTFSLVNEYQGRDGPLFHLDIYRLTPAEFLEAGLDEYLNQRGLARRAITLVEWADLWPAEFWPPKRLEINLEPLAGGRLARLRTDDELLASELAEFENWRF